MQVTGLQEYVDTIMHYPPVLTKFHMVKSEHDKSIRYCIQYEHDTSLDDETKLLCLTQQFHRFTQQYEIKVARMNLQLTETIHAMTGYEHFIKNHFSDYKGKIDRMAGDIVACTIAEINRTIEHSMKTLHDSISQKSEAFESDLNNIVDNIIQDVYAASDEVHAAMQDSKKDALSKFVVQLQQESEKCQRYTPVAPSNPPPLTSSRFPMLGWSPRFEDPRIPSTPVRISLNLQNLTPHTADLQRISSQLQAYRTMGNTIEQR
jgi:hypothetical protein